MNYLIIVGLALIVPAVIVGNSLLDESQRYVLTLDGKSSNDLYLEFYEVESEKSRQVAIDEGFVLVEGEKFEITNDWKGNFLFEDKLFFMTGNAESTDKEISVFITGKFLEKTSQGNMYDVTVHIHSDQPIEFHSKGKIRGIISEDTEQVASNKIIDLLFMIKDSHHRYQDQEYIFTTKLYDKKLNPTQEWNVKGGEISGAMISVQAFDMQGNAIREINGTTNEYGWFEGKFPLGKSFPKGEYSIVYTAEYQGNISREQRPLYVFEVDHSAEYRHFIPTADIDRGKWKDDFGNGNDLMFDDIDEYDPRLGMYASIDHSDYVRSTNLNDKTNTDTLQIKISRNGGVTKDHQHIIAYTIGKDSAGGNRIDFTVSLLDGTREIAQWTHPDVDENFSLIINTLTRDQSNLISDYNNLSLKFDVECIGCSGIGGDRRAATISWAHMFV